MTTTAAPSRIPSMASRRNSASPTVRFWLEWAIRLHSNAISLLLDKFCHAGTKGWEVERSNLPIQIFGQVNIFLVSLGFYSILDEVKL